MYLGRCVLDNLKLLKPIFSPRLFELTTPLNFTACAKFPDRAQIMALCTAWTSVPHVKVKSECAPEVRSLLSHQYRALEEMMPKAFTRPRPEGALSRA
jgi:hypothetical protein